MRESTRIKWTKLIEEFEKSVLSARMNVSNIHCSIARLSFLPRVDLFELGLKLTSLRSSNLEAKNHEKFNEALS